jgi:RNase H-like domain found in reverse transcriptase
LGQRKTESFEYLKQALCTAPVLRTFDPKLLILVTTYASGFAIGAFLEQDEHRSRRPVSYFSRTMNPHEQNYHAQEQELLAIVEAFRHWRSYLHGQAFLVQTDHASLQYLTTQDHLTPLQVRWLERLIDFDFKIVHISGKTNLVADSLSRSPKDIPSCDKTNQAILLDALRRTIPHPSHTTKIHFIFSLQLNPQNLENLRLDYLADPEFTEHFSNPQAPYSLRNGLLHFKEKVCVPVGNIRLSLLHYRIFRLRSLISK